MTELSPNASSLVHTSKQSGITERAEHLKYTRAGNPAYDIQAVSDQETQFRHSGWAVRRSKIWQSFVRTCRPGGRLAHFANCGSCAFLQHNPVTHDVRISCNKCHDRFCVACQSERAAIVSANIADLIKRPDDTRFYTFTLRHNRTSLTDQIDRLYVCFSRLRHRQSFQRHCTGGAAFLEVKVGNDGLWHVHLHCIIEGLWWDQSNLASEWMAVTGDSSIVDVRSIHDVDGRARYVTKYVTKPADASVYRDKAKLDEFICCMGGRRLCLTFGTWRGQKLTDVTADEVKWTNIGTVDGLRSRAAEGDADALRWLQAAARKYPLFATLFAIPPPESGDFSE